MGSWKSETHQHALKFHVFATKGRTVDHNPWGLTPRQAETLDAYCDLGCQKLAAAKLAISPRTAEGHCNAAKAKINPGGAGITYILEWDRWRQARELERKRKD